MRTGKVPYRRTVIDVSAALNRVQVEPRESPVIAIEVRDLPGALPSINLHFGLDEDPVLVRQGSRVRVPAAGESLGAGVFLSCGAGGAGAVAELLIFTEDARRIGSAFEVIDAAGGDSSQLPATLVVPGDDVAQPASALGTWSLTALFDGATWDRMRAGSAAVLAAFSSLGAALVTKPGQWSQGHTPVAATQATTTRAAGAAGVRHVCTGISATLATGATAQAVALQINLRDGVTGAGTILWTKQVILPINGLWDIDLSDLNVVGSAATAITLEFSGAGVAGSFQSVSLSGYDAS